jgi:thiol-disulfide isomerase/thioredoxin
MNHYLAANQFPHLLVYFRANWNPNCKLTDQHINKIASENGSLQVLTVDSDVAHKIARHYSVKAEPEFVYCLYGDEVIRQIGPNYEGLVDKYNKMVALGQHTEF